MKQPRIDQKQISYVLDRIRRMASLVKRHELINWDVTDEVWVTAKPMGNRMHRESGGLKSITVKVEFAPGLFPERDAEVCPVHNDHPHDGARCLDCSRCVIGIGAGAIPSDAEWVAWFLALTPEARYAAASRIIESEMLRSLPR